MPADDASPGAPIEALRSAATLSGQMLAAAEAGDWDRLVGLEGERSRCLDDAIGAGQPGALANVSEAASLLATCLRLNDQISALTRLHMTGLSDLLAETGQIPPGSASRPRPNG